MHLRGDKQFLTRLSQLRRGDYLLLKNGDEYDVAQFDSALPDGMRVRMWIGGDDFAVRFNRINSRQIQAVCTDKERIIEKFLSLRSAVYVN